MFALVNVLFKRHGHLMTGLKARAAANRVGYGMEKRQPLCCALLADESIGATAEVTRSGGYGGTLRGAALCALEGLAHDHEIAIFGMTVRTKQIFPQSQTSETLEGWSAILRVQGFIFSI